MSPGGRYVSVFFFTLWYFVVLHIVLSTCCSVLFSVCWSRGSLLFRHDTVLESGLGSQQSKIWLQKLPASVFRLTTYCGAYVKGAQYWCLVNLSHGYFQLGTHVVRSESPSSSFSSLLFSAFEIRKFNNDSVAYEWTQLIDMLIAFATYMDFDKKKKGLIVCLLVCRNWELYLWVLWEAVQIFQPIPGACCSSYTNGYGSSVHLFSSIKVNIFECMYICLCHNWKLSWFRLLWYEGITDPRMWEHGYD